MYNAYFKEQVYCSVALRLVFRDILFIGCGNLFVYFTVRDWIVFVTFAFFYFGFKLLEKSDKGVQAM